MLQAQHLARTVRARIPFEVAFNINTQISSNIEVAPNSVEMTVSVLRSTSVVMVDPGESSLAEAQLELVTAVSAPLYLESMVLITFVSIRSRS